MSGGIVLSPASAKTREQIVVEAAGLIGEAFPIIFASGNLLMIGGTVQYTLFGVRAGDVVSTLGCIVSTAGSGLTLVKLGLYDTAGNRLAASADVKASFTSAGIKEIALATPYVVPSDRALYAAIIATGTTPPTVREAIASSAIYYVFSGGASRGMGAAGQTDLDATESFSYSNDAVYFGWK